MRDWHVRSLEGRPVLVVTLPRWICYVKRVSIDHDFGGGAGSRAIQEKNTP